MSSQPKLIKKKKKKKKTLDISKASRCLLHYYKVLIYMTAWRRGRTLGDATEGREGRMDGRKRPFFYPSPYYP